MKVPKTREFAVLKAADALAATVELVYGFAHSVAVLSLNHTRVRFAETRDMYVRIAAEMERSAEQAKETLVRSIETAKIVAETAVSPLHTKES